MLKINQFNSQIFYTKFNDQYTLGMFSLRPAVFGQNSKKYMGKRFDLFSYMEDYAKKDKSCTFNFTARWGGYCFPSDCLKDVVENGMPENKTKYDDELLRIYDYCLSKSDKFCYIVYKDPIKLHHELAHSFYNLYDGYRLCANINYDALSKDHLLKINKQLKIYGYSKSEYRDETQAFLSSNPADLYMERDVFVNAFVNYYKKSYKEIKRF